MEGFNPRLPNYEKDNFKRKLARKHSINVQDLSSIVTENKELKEGLGSLGKGFRQGLFDKGSTLTSKPVNSDPDEVKDRYVLIEVDGGDEYFIENIEPVRRLEPGEEILFTGPSVKYIKNRLAEMKRQDILDVVKLRIRSTQLESIYNKCKNLMEDVTMKNSSKYFTKSYFNY